MKGIIIGAGIGGLTTAVALKRSGVQVAIYEAAPTIEPVGAGIMMAPNAMWVFAQLGIEAAVVAAGAELQHASIQDHRGRVLQTVDMTAIGRRFGHGSVVMHRAEIHQILTEQIEPDTLHLGKRCVACRQTAESVVATFEDGTEASGDFLIGADGLNSVVRQTIFPDARLRYAGQTCWRGVVSATIPGPYANSERWGPGLRVGLVPIGAGRVYWFATENCEAGGVDEPDPRPRLQELFGGFAEPVPSILGQTEPDSIVRHDLYDLHPLPHWSIGRITLLGDAAHAPTPNLGQGGAQAVEDAWVLADELSRAGDPALAFERYEQRRIEKANRIIRDSRRFGWISGFENPVLCAIRNRLVRWTPDVAARRTVDWLFRAPR